MREIIIPNLEIIVYDGFGHAPHEEDPATTAADARRFLFRQQLFESGDGFTDRAIDPRIASPTG